MNPLKPEQHQIKVPTQLIPEGSEQILPIDKITPSSLQPRRYFAPEAMKTLVESIKQHGILQPLLVRKITDEQYELVAGERRYRAAQELKLEDVPVVIKELSDNQAKQVALLENLQREDLNPVEETEGILNLLSIELDKSLDDVKALFQQAARSKLDSVNNVIHNAEWQKVTEVFQVIGRFTPNSFRTNRLPLLNLSLDILEAIRGGKIEYTKARVIARIKDNKVRQELLNEAIDQALSLVDIKKRVTQLFAEESSTDQVSSFKTRMEEIVSKFKKAKTLDDPEKQKEVEKLLTMLEGLFLEDVLEEAPNEPAPNVDDLKGE